MSSHSRNAAQHHDLPGSASSRSPEQRQSRIPPQLGGGGGGGTSSSGVGQLLGGWAAATSQTVQQWTVKKYNLPDKTVASQVLMYRQLLHTTCRPGLRLTRPYQGTPAQQSVRHMPWWETTVGADGKVIGMEQTGQMCLSYDNLIQRLWYKGALQLYTVTAQQQQQPNDATAPIPHEYWVSRLGFQQPDPVTDFRSGGILSLAMMVWIVESCPAVYQRFCRSIPILDPGDDDGDDKADEEKKIGGTHLPTMSKAGDSSVLPFGITSINVTGMMAKFLMLSKSTDRMDALLSQKPFWQMFSDPNALLACQELALDMLADVVQELLAVRRLLDGEQAAVTVFDFSHILSVTEKRVEFDLLGAGPLTVQELRLVHRKLQAKYQLQLEKQLQRIRQEQTDETTEGLTPEPKPLPQQERLKEHLTKQASGLGAAASGLGAAATGLFSKIKKQQRQSTTAATENATATFTTAMPQPTIAELPPAFALPAQNYNSNTSETITFESATAAPPPDFLSGDVEDDEEDGWANVKGAADQVSNFSITDDDEEDLI